MSWLMVACGAPQEQAPPPTNNLLVGLFTEEQATSVEELFARDCASCHGANLRGTEVGNSLIGARFQQKWGEKSLGDLFRLTKSTMPSGRPEAYDDETYASLLAFILRANNYPSGDKPLPATVAALDRLAFGPPSPKKVMERYFRPKAVDKGVETIEGDWRQHRADVGSSNYSALDQINRENVGQLKVAWRWKSDNFGPQPEYYFKVTPLMVNGVLYFTAGSRRAVIAADARTGETLWMHTLNEGERMAYTPRQNSGRGVAYWEDANGNGRVVYITPGYQLIALDARTGRRIPSFGDEGIVDLKVGLGVDPITSAVGSTSPPIIVNGVIVMGACFPAGTAPISRNEVRGDIMGYDVRTGRQLWTFHTIPQEGEWGNDTWENESWKYTGNTGAWAPLSADPELGYVYLPMEAATGDYYGGHRLGDNLFSQSLVCLDAKTGKRVWHYQLIHHDIWDYDTPCPPVLADITVDGRDIMAVVQVTKQAFTYVFDRVTGEPVWPIEERPVPPSDVPGERASPTQPFPTWPLPFDRQNFHDSLVIDFTPEIKAAALEITKKFKKGNLYTPLAVVDPPETYGSIVLPDPVGGANWQGAVLDRETNIIYVSSTTSMRTAGLQKEPEVSDMNYIAWSGGSRDGPWGLPLAKPPWGRITAIDLNTGEHLWMVPNSDAPQWLRDHPKLKGVDLPRTGNPDRVGLLVTKTLLFAGEGSGLYAAAGGGGNVFRAYDKATGEIVAEIELPANQAGVPMTYSVNGKQYIIVAVGAQGHPGELVALSL